MINTTKFFSEAAHRDAFLNGNLILKPHTFYRITKSDARDPKELSFNNIELLNTVYLLCLHGPDHKDESKYGNFSAKITDIKEFFEIIASTIKPALIGRLSKVGYVTYYNEKNPENCPVKYIVGNCDTPETPDHIPFRKRDKYSSDKEVRMAFFVDEKKLVEFDKKSNSSSLEFFRFLPYSAKFLKTFDYSDGVVRQFFLNNNYFLDFIDGEDSKKVIKLDNFNDYKSSKDDLNRWSYRDEHYIEWHLKIPEIKKFLEKCT